MKTIITITLILCSIGVSAQFHVRVECWGKSDNPDYQDYFIKYTNNNWKTSHSINHSFDISDPDFTPFNVCYTPYLFMSIGTAKHEAIDFAKQFKSFAICEAYNKDVLVKYHKLLAYRKAHPFKKKVINPLVNKNCCKTDQIY